MADVYYGLPLKFSDVFKKKELARVDAIQSMFFNVRLILRSHFGENRFDSTYGCSVWDRDFEVIDSHSAWSEELSQSIRETLITHEKRMQNIKVDTKISEQEFTSGTVENVIHRIKRKITVVINFNYHLTNEAITLTEVLYISPLSIEEAQ